MGILQISPFTHPRCLNSPSANVYLANSSNNLIGVANTFSVSIWVKPISGTGVNFFGIGTASTNRILLFYNVNNLIQVTLNGSGGAGIKNYSYDNTVFPNVWAHIVFTWDGTNLVTYVNGNVATATAMATDTSGTMTDTARPVGIGAQGNGSAPAGCQVSQVGVWSTVLSASEVLSLYNGGNGSQVDLRAAIGNYVSFNSLQHYWLCGYPGSIGKDFGLASLLIDVGTNATAVEASDISSECPNTNNYGRIQDYSIDMDGSTERLRSTTARTIGISNAWTVNAFILSNRDTAQETFFEMRAAGTNVSRLRFQKRGDLSTGQLEVDLGDSGGTIFKDYSFNNKVPVGVWTGISATWDGTTLLVYKDGILVSPDTITTDIAGVMATSARQVGFGIGAQADQFFQGLVHSAGVWSTVLSSDQVAIIGNPYYARWLNLMKNGFGYTGAGNLVQWFRAGIGSLDGITTGSILVANDVIPASAIVAGGLNQGQQNLTYTADVVRSAPGN